jgi:hemerythrin-like domain-containing protein
MFNAALGTIYDEHRSLAAVVQGLRFLVGRFRRDGVTPEFDLLRAMLRYLQEFPARLHHPKEEAFLFSCLQKRTREADALIAELFAEHNAEAALLQELAAALEVFAGGQDGGATCFADVVDRYSGTVMRHLAREEHVLMPLARRHLLPEDWVEIGVAFSENGDPRFEADAEADYAELFRRILTLGGKHDACGLGDPG